MLVSRCSTKVCTKPQILLSVWFSFDVSLAKIIQDFIISKLNFYFIVCAIKHIQKLIRIRTANLPGENEQTEIFMLAISFSTMTLSLLRVPGQIFKALLLFHHTTVEFPTIVTIQRQENRLEGGSLLALLFEKYLQETVWSSAPNKLAVCILCFLRNKKN